MNSAAVRRPQLIDELARSSARSAWCWPSTPSADPVDGGWEVFVAGGRTATGRDAVEWAREAAERGAGEILLTSMDRDGTQDGYDLELTAAVASAVGVPVIASGGAGELDHLVDAARRPAPTRVLCASIFHYGRYTVARGQGAPGRGAGSPSAADRVRETARAKPLSPTTPSWLASARPPGVAW